MSDSDVMEVIIRRDGEDEGENLDPVCTFISPGVVITQ